MQYDEQLIAVRKQHVAVLIQKYTHKQRGNTKKNGNAHFHYIHTCNLEALSRGLSGVGHVIFVWFVQPLQHARLLSPQRRAAGLHIMLADSERTKKKVNKSNRR